MIRLRLTLATAATIAAAAIVPSAAGAFGVTLNTAAPASTQAGANSDFTLDMKFQRDSINDTVKDLEIALPPGVVGSAVAADVCPADTFRKKTCAASTAVGTANAGVTATGIGLPATAAGTVYSITPSGDEPVRLGILLKPKALGLPLGTLRSESAIELRPSDGGLTSTVLGLPNKYLGLKTAINSLQLKLNATANGKPFLRNPTSCGAATTTVDATSYSGTTKTSSAGFTPTGCDQLDFSPSLSASVDGGSAEGSLLGLDAIVSQDAGEAGAKAVSVTLPYGVSVNLGRLTDVCSADDAKAGTCAASSVVGSASAVVPILAEPLSGPVRLVDGGGDLPEIELDLRGAVDLKLRGVISISPDGRLVNTFEGIPDVPLSQFALRFAGGDDAALLAGAPLCAGTQFNGTTTSQAGATAALTAPAAFPGCTTTPDAPAVAAAPAGAGTTNGTTGGGASGGVAGQESSGTAALRTSVKLGRVGGKRGKRVALTVRARSSAKKVRTLTVRLPQGLQLATKRLRATLPKGASLKGSTSRVLKLTLRRSGSTRITLKVTRGASASKSLRAAKNRRKLTFRVTASYVGGGSASAKPSVRTTR